MPTLTKWAIEKDKAVVEGVGQGAPTAMAFLIYLDMAKELPYFKFETGAWENGNIQMVSREQKGLFIDLCSLYWSRLGDVPLKLAALKLCAGNATALESLCEDGVIAIEDGLIRIDFLELQLSGFNDISEKNRQNAYDGWEKRRKNKVLSDRNATVMPPQCETDAIREDKIIEDKIKDNSGFDFFWDQYHDITSMPKTDKDPALKHWKKLTDTERNLAIEKITDYYDSVENKKYVKKARTYLADKSFNDEHVNAEKKEEQYPDAVKMLAALGGYGPSIYPAIVKRLHEVQYKSEFGFEGILKLAVMAVENFGERGVNAYTWKAIESIDDPELRRDFRNRVKSHGYDAIHQRMVKKYLNEPAGKI